MFWETPIAIAWTTLPLVEMISSEKYSWDPLGTLVLYLLHVVTASWIEIVSTGGTDEVWEDDEELLLEDEVDDEELVADVAVVPLIDDVGVWLVPLVGFSLVGFVVVELLPPLQPTKSREGTSNNNNDFFILFEFERSSIKFIIDAFFLN